MVRDEDLESFGSSTRPLMSPYVLLAETRRPTCCPAAALAVLLAVVGDCERHKRESTGRSSATSWSVREWGSGTGLAATYGFLREGQGRSLHVDIRRPCQLLASRQQATDSAARCQPSCATERTLPSLGSHTGFRSRTALAHRCELVERSKRCPGSSRSDFCRCSGSHDQVAAHAICHNTVQWDRPSRDAVLPQRGRSLRLRRCSAPRRRPRADRVQLEVTDASSRKSRAGAASRRERHAKRKSRRQNRCFLVSITPCFLKPATRGSATQ